MSRGEGGRTRAVTQVRICSYTIHTLFTHYSHTIRTPFTHTIFATIRALFAHYSHTIRAGSHRFTSVRADSRMFKLLTHVRNLLCYAWFAPVSDSVRTICARNSYSQVFTLFARYSHYSHIIRRYSRSIRVVFARYSQSIRTHSHMFAPRSHLGRTLFATIRNHSRRVASVNICECVNHPPPHSHVGRPREASHRARRTLSVSPHGLRSQMKCE